MPSPHYVDREDRPHKKSFLTRVRSLLARTGSASERRRNRAERLQWQLRVNEESMGRSRARRRGPEVPFAVF